MEKKFYTAKYDRVFKTILCNEDDTSLFQEFLSRLLKKKVKIIEFLRMDKIMEYWYNQNIQKVNEYKHLIMLDLKNNELEKLSKGDDFVEKFNEKITE